MTQSFIVVDALLMKPLIASTVYLHMYLYICWFIVVTSKTYVAFGLAVSNGFYLQDHFACLNQFFLHFLKLSVLWFKHLWEAVIGPWPVNCNSHIVINWYMLWISGVLKYIESFKCIDRWQHSCQITMPGVSWNHTISFCLQVCSRYSMLFTFHNKWNTLQSWSVCEWLIVFCH